MALVGFSFQKVSNILNVDFNRRNLPSFYTARVSLANENGISGSLPARLWVLEGQEAARGPKC